MKKDRLLIIHSLLFLVIIIFSLIFFGYTNRVVYENVDGEIINTIYPTVSLIINTVILILNLAIIEISIISIRKLPKDKNDYSKALVISNIILGSVLNVFIVAWPIVQYLIKCR